MEDCHMKIKEAVVHTCQNNINVGSTVAICDV